MSTVAVPGMTFTLFPARTTVGVAVLERSAPKVRRCARIAHEVVEDERRDLRRLQALEDLPLRRRELARHGLDELRHGLGRVLREPRLAELPRAAPSLTTALSGLGIEPWPGSPSNVARTQHTPFSAVWMG